MELRSALRDLDAAWLGGYEQWLAEKNGVQTQGKAPPPMFLPYTVRGLTLKNRIVVSPMAQYKAVDGCPTDWHFAHYAERAKGGAGLVYVEMTCVSPEGLITPGCPGLYAPEHEAAWKRLTDFVHAETDAKRDALLAEGRRQAQQIRGEGDAEAIRIYAQDYAKDPRFASFFRSLAVYRKSFNKKSDFLVIDPEECIDCTLCVQVCPTGIDIRDGLQYECINCGACVDACDQTMERMGYPKGLISYTTEHKLAHSETQVARPKLIGYGLVMVVMLGVFVYNAMSIMPMGLDILRDRNQLFRENSEGLIENTYTLKILNKTLQSQTYQLDVEGLPEHQWFGPREVTLKPGEIFTLPVSLAVDPFNLKRPTLDVQFVLKREGAAPDDSKGTLRQPSKFISRL